MRWKPVGRRLLLLVAGGCCLLVASLLLTTTCSHYRPPSESVVASKLRSLNTTNHSVGVKECVYRGRRVSLQHLRQNVSRLSSGVPRLRHSTWRSEELPATWTRLEKECLELNGDWASCFWNDGDLERLVAATHGDMLPAFLRLPYAVQRADVGRYVVMETWGGLYRDTNIGCIQSLDSLLSLPAHRNQSLLLLQSQPLGVGPDLLLATPRSAFFRHVVSLLPHRRSRYGLPYLDVMLGTGPLFLLEALTSFSGAANVTFWSASINEFFYFIPGGTWHCVDGRLLWWSFQNLRLLLFVFLFVLLFLVILISLLVASKRLRRVKLRILNYAM